MTAVVDAYRQLTDPDYYPGGRFFHLEDPAFRDIYVMTDALTSGYESSQVNGIWAYRMNLYGICVGKTTMEQWREALGQPESSVTMDDAAAYEYWMVAGISDYYTMGAYKLRLHADESGSLYCLQLIK